jgi:hypothetical protein
MASAFGSGQGILWRMAMKSKTREPYGKSACTFTDGFTLTFPLGSPGTGEAGSQTLHFEQGWLSDFGAHAKDRSGMDYRAAAARLPGFSRLLHPRA